jgi:putative flippase GtrA
VRNGSFPAAPYPVVLATLFRGGKFMIVAWLGMLVNTGCLYLFKGVFGIRLIPASILAIEIAIIHNFIWFRLWTWKDRPNKQPFFRQLIKFNVATGAVDFAANVTVLWSLATIVGIHYLVANILGMIAPPFIKFWLNERFIFKGSANDSSNPNPEVSD